MTKNTQGLRWWLSGKESACQCRRCRFNPWVRKIPWWRKWQPTPVFFFLFFHSSILAWKIPQRKSLVGYSPWGRKESDTSERLFAISPLADHLNPIWALIISKVGFSLSECWYFSKYIYSWV